MTTDEISDDFKFAVLGREITGIVYIHGWVSIILEGYEFDSDGFTIYSDVTVISKNGRFRTGEEQFRDNLHEIVGTRITGLEDGDKDFGVKCENNVTFQFALGMPSDSYTEVALFKSGDLFVIFENELFEDM